jgi:outer membrane protein assembly factor BamB
MIILSQIRKVGLLIIVSVFILVLLYAAWRLFIFNLNRPEDPKDPQSQGTFPTQPAWVFRTQEKIPGTPFFSGGKIFIPTSKNVYAVDSNTGNLLWKSYYQGLSYPDLSFRNNGVPPILCDGILVVPSQNDSLTAFSEQSGAIFWNSPYDPGEPDNLLHPEETNYVESLSCAGDTLFVTRFNRGIYAIHPKTGENIWINTEIENRGYFATQINEKILYTFDTSFIYACDPDTGNILWKKDIGEAVSSILLENDILYVAYFDPNPGLLAFDLSALKPIWDIKTSLPDTSLFHYLAIDKETIYTTGDSLIAFDKNTGKMKWNSNPFYKLGKPVILGNTLYVRDPATNLYAFDIQTGKYSVALKIQANWPSMDSLRNPIDASSLLVIPFGDDRLFAYSP